MDRIRRSLTALVALGLIWSGVGTAIAAYSDAPPGAWYKSAVDRFLDAGHLDSSQTRFRAADDANRAEFVTLLQRIRGETMVNPATGNFDDVSTSMWFYRAIETAAHSGWIKGDNDCYGKRPCYARPAASINRAEAAALIVRAFQLDATGAAPRFSDNTGNQWYSDAIQTAADHCVLQGDSQNRRVRPADRMNRAEMVVMLDRTMEGLQYGSDCHADHPVAAGIDDVTAVEERAVEVDFTVDIDPSSATSPSVFTIREGSSVIPIRSVTLISDRAVRIEIGTDLLRNTRYTFSVSNLKTNDGRVFSTSRSFTGFSELQEEGELTVSLASNNPTGTTLPRGTQATVLSIDLKASCDAEVAVEHLTVSHRGFGDRSDIEGLYAIVNGSRRTRVRSIQSGDGTADLRFSKALIIPACKSERVEIVADIETSATVSGEHAFSIDRSNDVAASADDIRGSFPLRGNTFRIASVTSGTVDFAYRTVSPNGVKVGDMGVVVGKFQLSANAVENQTIYSITLKQDGSASDGDVQNIRIRRTDGTVIARTIAQTSHDFATFFFDPPFVLRQGDRLTFEIVGDIKGGAAENIKFQLAEPSDLFAIGSKYGSSKGLTFGSQVSIDHTTAPDSVSIDAGRLTVEIDGPTQRAYTRDNRDAVLANVRFSSEGDPLDLHSMYVAVFAETSTGAGLAISGDAGADEIHELISGVKLRNADRGRSISAVRLTGNNDSASDSTKTYQIYRFDDLIVRDVETWQFMVDFKDNGSGRHPLKGDRFAVRICVEPTHVQQNGVLATNTTGCDFGGLLASASTAYQMRVEGFSTGDHVNDVRPRGTIGSSFQRISVSELVIAVSGQGTSDTTVRGAKNIPLLRFEARAGEAKDILLTKAVFEAESGSLLNAQNYSLWVDTDNDGVTDLALERGVAAKGGTIAFTRLTGGGRLLTKEETSIFEVRADISSSTASDRLRLRFATNLSSYIEAEDVDRGSALSGIQTDGTCSAASLCDILVRTENAKLWTIASQGNLFVRLDSTPIRSHQLLGGTMEPVMRLEFRADNEAIVVTDLQITSSGSTASSVDRLELFTDGATTPFATASVGSCGSDDVLKEWEGLAVQTFCAKMRSQQLVIPAGQTMDIAIHARLKTDNDGAISGETVHFFLSGQAVVNNATGSGAVRGFGLNSSNALIANNGDSNGGGEVFIGTSGIATNNDIIGNPHDIVLSKITSVTNANPDANNTSIPVGTAPIGQFRFSAAQNNNSRGGTNEATLSGIIFTVNATNTALDASAFRLYNKGNASIGHACTAMQRNGAPITGSASGSFLVECTGLLASEVNTGVPSNGTLTLALEANVTDPHINAGNSTLQVSLQDIASRSINSSGFDFNASHVHWVDRDQSITNFYWLDLPESTVQSTSYRS